MGRKSKGGKELRVAVDIGGTFTDVVVFDEAKGSLALAKALSTPAELARGVQDGLIKAAVPLDRVETLIHGSTIVVNAIVERKGAKTALVTTKGFRDVYEIGRINRPESFNPRFRKHRPLVPREDIFEVSERKDDAIDICQREGCRLVGIFIIRVDGDTSVMLVVPHFAGSTRLAHRSW